MNPLNTTLPFHPTFGRMRTLLLSLILHLTLTASAQPRFGLATGLSVLRNFSPQQKFTVVGQTVQAQAHFTPRITGYAWIEYYTAGSYTNRFTATAKSALTTPQQLTYDATASITLRHFSLGLKRYFMGGYRNAVTTNIYGSAGFGFLFGRVSNGFTPAVDTTIYRVSPQLGTGPLRRLTFDLGIGAEYPLNENFFLFADARTWLPASGNSSLFLHNQEVFPSAVMLTGGLRILFGLSEE